jgi:O-antigen ligase
MNSTFKIKIFVASFIILYSLHFTIIQAFVPDLTNIYYMMLFSSLIFVVKKNSINKVLFPLIIASVISLLLSEDLLPGSYLRWLTWIILLIFAAPFYDNLYLRTFKDYFWWGLLYLFIIITFVSFFWIILRLPSYGVNEDLFLGEGKYFRNGITLHEMSLAPISAIVAIFSLYNLIYNTMVFKRYIFIILFAISFATMLMGSSRTCLIGFAIVFILIILNRFKYLLFLFKRNIVITFFIALIGLALIPFIVQKSDTFLEENTHLGKKGLNNSREGLWKARLVDFELNPFSGAGFHSVSKNVVGKYDSGANKETGRVEFGSAYLQALSTMGILGFISFIFFLYNVFYTNISKLKSEHAYLYLYFFIFYLIHFIAEAYTFSAGAMLCLFFWLLTSQIYNMKPISINLEEKLEFKN